MKILKIFNFYLKFTDFSKKKKKYLIHNQVFTTNSNVQNLLKFPFFIKILQIFNFCLKFKILSNLLHKFIVNYFNIWKKSQNIYFCLLIEDFKNLFLYRSLINYLPQFQIFCSRIFSRIWFLLQNEKKKNNNINKFILKNSTFL